VHGGCNGATPVRIDVNAEALIVNGEESSPLADAARVLDAQGVPITRARVTVQLDSSRGVTLRDGRVACAGRADIPVRFSAGQSYADAVVRCRPAVAFRLANDVVMSVRGGPKPVPVPAMGPDAEAVTELRASIRIDDSTVARLTGGMVHPVALGSTQARVRVGGLEHTVRIAVVDPLFAELVELAPNEYHAWPLKRGYFRIALAPGSTGSGAMPEFRSDRARCGRLALQEGAFYCVVDSTGTIMVRNIGSQRRERVAEQVERWADSRR